MIRLGWLFLIVLAGISPRGFAAVDFEKDIAPILRSSCLACHSARAGMGNVRLHNRQALNATVSLGPLLTAGDPQKSALYLSLMLPKGNAKAMPPTGPLPEEQRERVRQWIAEGAVWPEGFELGARTAAPARARTAAPDWKDDLELAKAARIRIRERTRQQDETGMQAYAVPIPGSSVSIDFVPIPGGEFSMGTPETEKGRGADEGPVHRVKLEPFWMSKFETTWDAYRLFMFATEANEAQNPDAMVAATSRPTAPYVEMSFGMGLNGYPAISMTQHAANKFAQWLSLKTGHFYRLPTEAEWEYACRAGTSTAYSFGDDPAALAEHAWFSANSGDKYQQVGGKKPNPWGLYDMHGNVMEWTLDAHSQDFYAKGDSLALNPWNKPAEPYPHVARGGGWADGAVQLRCGARVPSDPSWKIQDPQLPKSIWYHTDAQWLGFRLVRPLRLPSAEEMFAYWNNGVEYD